MAAVEVISLYDVISKQAQLSDRPAPLALKPRLGQAGFLRADFGDRHATRVYFVRDGVQKRMMRFQVDLNAPERRLYVNYTNQYDFRFSGLWLFKIFKGEYTWGLKA